MFPPFFCRYWPRVNDSLSAAARRIMLLNWSQPFLHRSTLPSSSSFVVASIFYHLLISYSILTTFLTSKRTSWTVIVSILSRLCFIITRLYTFIFLFRLHAWWFALGFSAVHFVLMTALLYDRATMQENRILLKFVFSLITHSSIDSISVSALISLENISVFLHRLYLETFFSYQETTVRLIVFISILVSMQIIGFLLDTLSRSLLGRPDTPSSTITKL